jgi:ABC-type polysaccharide/polyol phosphate transport system ATPase subunit
MEVIKVKNVWKTFKVYHDKGITLKERLIFKNRNHYEKREVLKGIDLTINKGDVVGLIGENGSGKSTLLKLLTRIMYPDQGEIIVTGKVSSLLELGAGFHPDLSGKENIYTNASIFGLTKKEIDERLNRIIEFSELEDFIDNPVRTYSSGMYMRLAFSVAINVDADILLIDEILAVGDANFQAKCFDKLRDLKRSGTTIVLVTHDTNVVERFCSKAVWLNDGKMVIDSIATKVVDAYLSYMNDKKLKALEEVDSNVQEVVLANTDEQVVGAKDETLEHIDYSKNRFGLKYAEIVKGSIYNKSGVLTNVLKGGESVEIHIEYKVNKKIDKLVFGMGIYTMDELCLIGTNTQLDRLEIVHTNKQGVVKFKIKEMPLLTGKYILQLAIVDENGTPMDYYREYCKFNVINEDRAVGYISLNHKWEFCD